MMLYLAMSSSQTKSLNWGVLAITSFFSGFLEPIYFIQEEFGSLKGSLVVWVTLDLSLDLLTAGAMQMYLSNCVKTGSYQETDVGSEFSHMWES